MRRLVRSYAICQTNVIKTIFFSISVTHDSSHCRNGGIGFLGSFCLCPDNYAGQYCEKMIKESCDVMNPAQDYIYIDCSICRCTEGYLECTPQWTTGCGRYPQSKDSVEGTEYSSRRGVTRILVLYTCVTRVLKTSLIAISLLQEKHPLYENFTQFHLPLNKRTCLVKFEK